MSGNEKRKEKKYQNRKRKRKEKRDQLLGEYDNYDRIHSFNAIYWANRHSKQNTSWKADVQKYQMNLPFNMEIYYQLLKDEDDTTEPFRMFTIMERGHERNIRSVPYPNRVIQRSLCDNCFAPVMTHDIINTNAACQLNKGTDWMLDELKSQLQQFYRRGGNHNYGYIVLFDVTGYFDNIDQAICLALYDQKFEDKRIVRLLERLLLPMGYCDNKWFIDRPRYDEAKDDPDYRGKGLGLGSQISQNTGVRYLSPLDHYIRDKLRIHYYGRYMDDGYIICRTLSEANDVLYDISKFIQQFNVQLSPKKTKIVPLDKWFVFLKVKHRLTETGAVIRKIDHKSVIRERDKFKKWSHLIEIGRMTPQDASQAYASWKGYALKREATLIVDALDKEFESRFEIPAPRTKLEKRGSRNHRLPINAAKLPNWEPDLEDPMNYR